MKATLRIYFRNIMLFVRRDVGIDVWFIDGHQAHAVTANEIKDIDMQVVTIQDKNGCLSGPPRRVADLDLLADFAKLHPRPRVHDDIQNGTLSKWRKARVELRGQGTFRGLPSVHSHGALLEWEIPTFEGGRPTGSHWQRMTELAMYEVAELETPIHLKVGDEVEVPVREDERGQSVAEAFFIAGELERARDVEDEYRIHEFKGLSVCFEENTSKDLALSIPRTKRPKGPIDAVRTADPFCPNGFVSI
jgi:hypothetical protein